MKYKLICIDMDGTLLSDDHSVCERNLKAIKAATKKNVKIAITTGRIFASAKHYSDIIGVKTPVICSNGAYIRERELDKVIARFPLGKESAEKVVKITNKYDIITNFNTHYSVISNKELPSNHTYRLMNANLPNELKIKLLCYEDLNEAIERYHEDILKCICIDNDIEKIIAIKEELLKIPDIEVVSSNFNNFEIMSKGTSKGKAVDTLAKLYNIKREEVICIGDSENDLSMIKYAGLGVVMGNAEEYMKKEADYITLSNNEGGVGAAIEEFVLK